MSRSSSPKSSELMRRKSQKNDVPFYESLSNAPTSSQIIKAVKEKLHDSKRNQVTYLPESANLARTLNSNRPFTPRDDKRSLFGPKSTRPVNERPPSSFSIGSKSFETDATTGRPISATRLSPIERKNSSKPTLNAQTSLESESRSSLRNEDTDLLKHSKSASRLAPLDKNFDKLKFKNDDNNKFKNEQNKNTDKVDLIWKKFFEPLVNQMDDFFKNNQIDLFCESSDVLDQLVSDHQIYSKTNSKRSLILKILFKYLDTESDKIKLKISRNILNMKITGSNLTNICRLLFSISRNSDNDVFFLDSNIIESLFSVPERFDFKENSDTVIYFCGAIKNLSENAKILKLMSSTNLENILIKIIKDLSKYFKDTETLKAEAGHALVQITATIRNLADLFNTRQKFLKLKFMEHLVYILKYYTGDAELMLNVSRILSKLTLHCDCCQDLVQYESFYKSFLKIMIKHESKQDLVVRIGFVLGNVTGRYEDARIRFIREKYSIETLLNTLKTYFNNDQQNSDESSGNLEDLSEAEANPNEEVLIKYVRVVANLAISEQVGEKLANRQDVLDILLKILEFKDLSCEELIINTIVTINNLSFYYSQLITENSDKIVNCMMKFLLSHNLEAITEVFRVLANLSRANSTRGYLAQRKVNILAIAYLNTNNRELIYIVIGFLINIMTDQENKAILRQENGVKKLINLLNEIGPSDWQMSSMICKLFMNYSDNTKPIRHFFEQNEIKLLTVILKELLNENFALRSLKSEFKSSAPEEENTENLNDYMDYLWRHEFQPVAKFLIARLIRN